jgi:hypothetical protein
VRNEDLDVVVCLNPTSSLHPTRAWNPAEWIAHLVRDGTGRRLGYEARALRERGTKVVLIQPTKEDLDAMGPNLMSRRNRQRTIEVAQQTVAQQLAEPANREALTGLPPGPPQKIHRPDLPSSEWPDLLELSSSQTA